jgi:copper(I)-binding protein
MKTMLLALALAALPLASPAQEPAVRVEGAWARASVQGQSGTGAFMTLTAAEALTLVGVSSPAAGVAELHEMKMEGDVMKMRAMPALTLPAGRAVELKPGGYHLMLMELKAPLKPDTLVPVTLHLRDAKGAARKLEVSVPVSLRAPAGQGSPAQKH